LTLVSNRGILQYMKNFTTKNFDLRPVVSTRAKWEVQRLVDGNSTFFQHLTDALMYVEGVTKLDDISSEARQYWNMVAMS
jgi:hypothetical protein